jgi:hypothetical protein
MHQVGDKNEFILRCTVRETSNKPNVISQDKRNINKITVETSNGARVTSAHFRNQTSILQLLQPVA